MRNRMPCIDVVTGTLGNLAIGSRTLSYVGAMNNGS
jgi:hypothetical protein